MRILLLGLLATATAASAVYSTGSPHHVAVNPIVVTGSGYRFYDRFCRAQYNNPTDRNVCMMRATGTMLPNSKRDDR